MFILYCVCPLLVYVSIESVTRFMAFAIFGCRSFILVDFCKVIQVHTMAVSTILHVS